MKITITNEGEPIVDCDTNLVCGVVKEGDDFRCIIYVSKENSLNVAKLAIGMGNLLEELFKMPEVKKIYKRLKRRAVIHKEDMGV